MTGRTPAIRNHIKTNRGCCWFFPNISIKLFTLNELKESCNCTDLSNLFKGVALHRYEEAYLHFQFRVLSLVLSNTSINNKEKKKTHPPKPQHINQVTQCEIIGCVNIKHWASTHNKKEEFIEKTAVCYFFFEKKLWRQKMAAIKCLSSLYFQFTRFQADLLFWEAQTPCMGNSFRVIILHTQGGVLFFPLNKCWFCFDLKFNLMDLI